MANNILEHLLEVEALAAAMVNDAQEEADRRVRENEERNRLAFEERFKNEIHLHEESLKVKREETKNNYNKALDDYRMKISNLDTNEKKFSVLLNSYLENYLGEKG